MSNKITVDNNGNLQVPDEPIVPFIEGDGTLDIWRATSRVLDAAVEKAFGQKKIDWKEVYAGEKHLRKQANGFQKQHWRILKNIKSLSRTAYNSNRGRIPIIERCIASRIRSF